MSKRYLKILVLVCVLLLIVQVSFAAQASPVTKPNVKILATGGTIAGAGVTSTTTVGYTAAVTPVDKLITNACWGKRDHSRRHR